VQSFATHITLILKLIGTPAKPQALFGEEEQRSGANARRQAGAAVGISPPCLFFVSLI